ncbi:Uncharacterised protein [uncultured archaeon]|nr:Uncharacterised protein [uncultured archaeon]
MKKCKMTAYFPKSRVTVQCFLSQGMVPICELVARSEKRTPQEMVNWMAANVNSKYALNFFGDYGVMHPTT